MVIHFLALLVGKIILLMQWVNASVTPSWLKIKIFIRLFVMWNVQIAVLDAQFRIYVNSADLSSSIAHQIVPVKLRMDSEIFRPYYVSRVQKGA